MILGVIADDFTGASDIGSALSKGLAPGRGLKCSLYLGIPEAEADGRIEAGIIALKTRSIPPEQAVSQSLEACDWLLAQGCEQIVFKYCSTFDSTPKGNIGPIIDALKARLGEQVVIVCPAFPAMGRTLYQGHLFVYDKLLNESSMAYHPLTPMKDSDVRRLLSQQSALTVGLISHNTVAKGRDEILTAISKHQHELRPVMVIDAINDSDIIHIVQACYDRRLVTGSAGIGFALPENFISSGKAQGTYPPAVHLNGPAVLLVGSCSTVTQEQIAAYAVTHPVLKLDIHNLMQQKFGVDEAMHFILQHLDRGPMICSNGEANYVAEMQQLYGIEPVATAIEMLLAQVACRAVEHGIQKVIVGGGETSGAVVSALNLGEMMIGGEVAVGVPVLLSCASLSLALVLKSGNFGDTDFFQKACQILESQE
ncbi:four-carbon acid sugar kinase family protein [Cedecea neteri]|uniref:3-oxo-tetronate kinase n=1 Tax=Cedecea neteri TaxID=158822 RepID=UPI0028931FEC|nr:3-oxo-tetronate kinase [Cedecea neteri]WNJ78025.1 four-carbon acid sugar kinase family protein [Cedecea neteri]